MSLVENMLMANIKSMDINHNKVPDQQELAPVGKKLNSAVGKLGSCVDIEAATIAGAKVGHALEQLEKSFVEEVLADNKVDTADLEVVFLNKNNQKAIIELIVGLKGVKDSVNFVTVTEAFTELKEVKEDLDKFIAAGKKK